MALILRKTSSPYLFLCCSFHNSSILEANSGRASGKAMKKILSGGSSAKKKRLYMDAPVLPSAQSFSQGAIEGRYSGSTRRTSVLNKLFIRHITDLMATGENSTEFLGHGIEINRVAVTPDFKGVNVFWAAKGGEEVDDKVEGILKKNAGYLRHELSTLRVMGVVPMISFVKDKQYSRVMELEKRLATADYGEDYEPSRSENLLKSTLELYAPLEPKIRDQIADLDEEVIEEEEDNEPLPPMPQDVLGLNHAHIMNDIRRAIKKSQAIHRLSPDEERPVECQTINENPIEFKNKNEKREAFRQFLQNREIQRSKARKLEKNYSPDLEFIKEEIRERYSNYFDNMDIYYKEDDDYVSDDEGERPQ